MNDSTVTLGLVLLVLSGCAGPGWRARGERDRPAPTPSSTRPVFASQGDLVVLTNAHFNPDPRASLLRIRGLLPLEITLINLGEDSLKITQGSFALQRGTSSQLVPTAIDANLEETVLLPGGIRHGFIIFQLGEELVNPFELKLEVQVEGKQGALRVLTDILYIPGPLLEADPRRG